MVLIFFTYSTKISICVLNKGKRFKVKRYCVDPLFYLANRFVEHLRMHTLYVDQKKIQNIIFVLFWG